MRGMNKSFSTYLRVRPLASIALVISALTLISFPGFASADKPERGISGRSFLYHMSSHYLGQELIAEETMIYFPEIPLPYARARKKAHDASKLNQRREFLEHYGLPLDEPIPEKMGREFGTWVPEDQKDRGVIDRINKADDAIANEIDNEFNPTPDQRRAAAVKEHVDDLIERGLAERLFPPRDGIYERGGTEPMRLASDYIANSPAEKAKWTDEERERMVRIAKDLENSPAFIAKLKKAKSHYRVEMRVQEILKNSHFTNDVRRGPSATKGKSNNGCAVAFAQLSRRRNDVPRRQ